MDGKSFITLATGLPKREQYYKTVLSLMLLWNEKLGCLLLARMRGNQASFCCQVAALFKDMF
jgi:hypothetical protein